jgi:hypothetical protein
MTKQILKVEVEVMDNDTREFETVVLDQDKMLKHMGLAVVARVGGPPYVVDVDLEVIEVIMGGADDLYWRWVQGPTLDVLLTKFVNDEVREFKEVKHDQPAAPSSHS